MVLVVVKIKMDGTLSDVDDVEMESMWAAQMSL